MKRAPNQPTSDLTIYAGIFVKTWHVADAGTLLPQHAHSWPHLTLLIRGSVRVWHDGDLVAHDFHAPATIKIAARVPHKFLTLAPDCTLACIHNADHADPDGEPPIAARASLDLED